MVISSCGDTPFTDGDRVTFELEEYGASRPSVVEWLVPDSYEEHDVSDTEAATYITQGHLSQLGNSALVKDYADADADDIGLLIGSSENIFPENFRVLSHGVVAIDLSTLAPVARNHRTW